MTDAAIVWFRNDLRIADNPALRAAMQAATTVLAVHIEEAQGHLRPRGGASRWWLHHSLNALAGDLASLGIELLTLNGNAELLLPQLASRHQARWVGWNRRYGPAEREVDASIKARLREVGTEVESFAGNVLVEPFKMETASGGPYSVYTPFWNALRQRQIPIPLPPPTTNEPVIPAKPVDTGYSEPAWAQKLSRYWNIGEAPARSRLEEFLATVVPDYPAGRDVPAAAATSRLSPHLALGEISPRQVWHAALAVAQQEPARAVAIDRFLSELAWREFNINQLYHRPDIAKVPMVEKFARMPWRDAPEDFEAWGRGRTGIPIVDAGMRELWNTGYMHNRVRMIAASLLAKNLLIDWRRGEEWFWDTLVDADSANNPGNWQWVAGCGLDAAPYFRIFNPVTQGERFDPQGDYVRRWIPELAEVPDRFVHKPWEAPAASRLDYPDPIVDLRSSRERALEAFSGL